MAKPNQNFRVKKGLEVGVGATFLFADDNGVGINSAAPRDEYNLDVRGDGFFETLDVINPDGNDITNPALDVVGYSTFTGTVFIDGDAEITGDIKLTSADLVNLNVSGIATINQLGFTTGIGSTLTVDYLRVNEDIDFRGTGIATIGGDPVFNTLTVLGFSTFAGQGGVSTFYDLVNIDDSLVVGAGASIVGVLTVTGDVKVSGETDTKDLVYDAGIGRTLTLDYLRINEDIDVKGTGIATIGGDPVFNTLEVNGISQLGNPDPTTGFTTVRGDLYVAGDLFIQDDIFYDEIVGRNLDISGIGTIRNLNVTGVGTFVNSEVTGISTVAYSTSKQAFIGFLTAKTIDAEEIFLDVLNVDQIGVNTITWNIGIGTSSSLEYATIGVSTITLADIEQIDAENISAGIITSQNLDVVGLSTFKGDLLVEGSIGIGNTLFVKNDVLIGGGITFQGDVTVEIDVEVEGDLNILGISTFAEVDIKKGTADKLYIEELDFNVGIGTTLTLEDLFVTNSIDVNGTGVATIGGDPVFNTLTVLGISTFGGEGGVSTFYDDVNITQTLFLGDLDSEGNIAAGGTITTNDLKFNTGLGTFLDVEDIEADTLRAGFATITTLRVADKVTGVTTFDSGVIIDGTLFDSRVSVGNAFLQGDNPIGGTPSQLSVDTATIKNVINVTGVGQTSVFQGDVEIVGDLYVDDITYDDIKGNTLSIGQSGYINDLYATDLTVSDQTILEDLYVSGIASLRGAGIATIFGDAEFSSLIVNPGFSSFVGPATFSSGLTVSGIATFNDRVELTDLNSDGFLNITDLRVAGFSTFVGVGTFLDTLYAKEYVGVASLITFYPAPLVGFGTEPPTTRPNGEPVQFGDVWFDETGLRQYIYYPNDPENTGTTAPFWIDANPVVALPDIGLQADRNDDDANLPGAVPGTGQIGLGTDNPLLVLEGTPENIVTSIDENKIRFSLPETVRITNLVIDGESSIGESTVADFVSTGIGSFNNLKVTGEFDGVGIATFKSRVYFGENADIVSLSEASFGGDLLVEGTTTMEHIDASSLKVTGIGTFRDIDSLSDRRLKDNIQPIENALERVSRLRGVTYEWINSRTPSMGIVAQEVEKEFPTLIHGTFPKSVNYNGLIGALIESVKELKSQNEELVKRIEKLEGDK